MNETRRSLRVFHEHTCIYVWDVCVTWLIHMCDMTHSSVWHDSLTFWARCISSCPKSQWVMSHIWMSHVTHMNESCHTYEWVMSHIHLTHTYMYVHEIHAYMYISMHTFTREWDWNKVYEYVYEYTYIYSHMNETRRSLCTLMYIHID